MNMQTAIAVPLTLPTARMALRPLRGSDKGLIEMYASDIRVSGPTRSIPHPLPPGATEAFIKTHQAPARESDVWVLDGTKADMPEVLGLLSLKRLDRGQSEVGYWLGHPFWRMGLAREALTALIAANPLDNSTMFAEVFQDNPRSAKLLTDLGFGYLGDAEKFCVARQRTIETWTYVKRMEG